MTSDSSAARGIMDETFQRLIAKADRIVEIELEEQEREERRKEHIEKITSMREEQGRYQAKIRQLQKRIEEVTRNLVKAEDIVTEHATYFHLINIYEGRKLQEKLQQEIDDYNWSYYSRLQDEIYQLLGNHTVSHWQTSIKLMEKQISELEQEENDLVIMLDTMLKILQKDDTGK